MSDANVVDVLSLNEATDLVQHTGQDVSYLFLGEMGIGKSHMLYELGKRMPEYQCMYAEVPTFDTSDITGVPFTEVINGVKVTRFAPNAMLNIQSDRPVMFMADEIGKGTRPVQNTFLRLFHEHKIGEFSLPKGSCVFATSNLAAEGLGDHVQEHFRNRGSTIEIRKPTAEEWIIWAMANGIHPVIIAWVKKYPRCFASYRDGDGNPYINYPTKPSKAFVSGRSLHKASHIMWKRDKLPSHVTRVAIAGCVGASAANDIITFADTYDRLPSWDAIVASPDTAYVPSNQDFAGNFVSVFSAVSLVERKTMAPWMAYCQRLPKEYQGVFALNVLTSPARSVALNNRAFVTWATQNHWMVGV
jgi:MoxR-like ATPase